jgi:hypothetical protein
MAGGRVYLLVDVGVDTGNLLIELFLKRTDTIRGSADKIERRSEPEVLLPS